MERHPARTLRPCLLLACLLLPAPGVKAQAGPRAGEWPSYARDPGSSKYSPLGQIGRDNVDRLKIAWRWQSPEKEHPEVKTWLFEATPLMVGGVLYTSTSLSQVAALDPATGKTLWLYDPSTWEKGTPTNLGFVHRGVAYWGGGAGGRILLGTGDAYLIALDARTGRPIAGFGDGGRVDLTKGLRRPASRRRYSVTSPPIVCRDVVIVGASILDYPAAGDMPPGDVRGFDVRSGKQLWTFHTIPQKGEVGNDTWEGDSWQKTGGVNVWAPMSADEDLGYVYLPCSTPTNDFYGGERPGANLFGESLVCVEAATGRRVWHYQTVHHGLWDYDLPAAPNLVDLTVGGKRVKAVAQVTKHGFCFVLDRLTGKPVWPVEERKVPAASAEGERAWPTQPFPTRPAPFDRQGAREDDLIDLTPQLRQEAREILARYTHGPLFTPASARGTIFLPGWRGGASWAGAAFDPETGWLYVPSVTQPIVVSLGRPFPFTSSARLVGSVTELAGPRGLPLFRPPFGRMTAIDLNTGRHVWVTPLGEGPRNHPALKGLDLPRLGWPRRGHTLLTKTLLLVGQEGTMKRSGSSGRGKAIVADFVVDQPRFGAYDKETGRLLWEMDLPANASGAPMTYAVGGKQLIVVAVGGSNIPAELVALSLP